MQEAEIMSFLRTILIILLVYYAVKLIARYMAPIIIKRAASKFEERVKQQQQSTTNQSKVGETVIDKKPNSKSNSGNSVGEYVDFEEVDD